MHLKQSSIVGVCGLAAALFAFGCGSSSTGTAGGDPAAAVAGSWTFTSGSIDPMCTGLTIAPVDLTGDTMVLTRTDSTHVALSIDNGGLMCNVHFTVSGTGTNYTATATTGGTCTVNVPIGTTSTPVVINISSWTLSVSGDTLTNAMNGTASASILTCTPTADGMATRVSGGG